MDQPTWQGVSAAKNLLTVGQGQMDGLTDFERGHQTSLLNTKIVSVGLQPKSAEKCDFYTGETDIPTDQWTNGWMDGSTDTRINEQMDGWMDRRTDGWTGKPTDGQTF